MDTFSKSVIQSLPTYNVWEPVWSTLLSNKKICLKIDWKIMDSNQSSPQFNPISPTYSPTSFNTASMTPYPPNNDSGYYSPSSPSSLQNPRVYSNPQSPFPPTTLFHTPKFRPHRQDIYASPTKPKPQHINSHKVSIKKPPTLSDNSNTHSQSDMKTSPDTTSTHSPSLYPVSPINTNFTDNPSPLSQSDMKPPPDITSTSNSSSIDPIPPLLALTLLTTLHPYHPLMEILTLPPLLAHLCPLILNYLLLIPNLLS